MTTTNTSLIRRLCSECDNDSWVDFVTTYESTVRSYVASRSQSRGLRLDEHDLNLIVQTVWIKLWQNFEDFQFDKKRARFRTFLYAVTVNALVDFIRRNRKYSSGRIPFESIDIQNAATKPDDEWDLSYRTALWQRIASALKAKVISENPTKWEAFEHHKIYGRPAKDVASQLSITPELVYQNSSRVMKEARAMCLAISDEEFADD